MSAQAQQMILASLGGILGVAAIAIAVWWLEVQMRAQERHRQRLADRAERDPGCQAWSAWMAYHRTHGAQLLSADVEARLVEQAQVRLLAIDDESAQSVGELLVVGVLAVVAGMALAAGLAAWL